MTKTFDDNARNKYLETSDFKELEYNQYPVSRMVVKEVDSKFARPYIATYHYSKTMPDSTKSVFAGFYGDKLAGGIVFGMGSGKNQYTALFPNIQNGQYLELTRMWSADGMPRNTESKLISESIKMLPSDVQILMSFADPSHNHAGTIYQATNWYYCGMSNGGRQLITEDGIEKHTRLLGIYKMRHPEYKKLSNDELMKIYGWTYKETSGKHRYVFLRGSKKIKKENFSLIKDKILPYPKTNTLSKEELESFDYASKN
jgi:hypothetical protein